MWFGWLIFNDMLCWARAERVLLFAETLTHLSQHTLFHSLSLSLSLSPVILKWKSVTHFIHSYSLSFTPFSVSFLLNAMRPYATTVAVAFVFPFALFSTQIDYDLNSIIDPFWFLAIYLALSLSLSLSFFYHPHSISSWWDFLCITININFFCVYASNKYLESLDVVLFFSHSRSLSDIRWIFVGSIFLLLPRWNTNTNNVECER